MNSKFLALTRRLLRIKTPEKSTEKVTEYRIIDTLDHVSPKSLQFRHRDRSWRFIHEKNVDLLEEDVTSDNCPLTKNGFVFTIDCWEGREQELRDFAARWPDIEKYFEMLREKQYAHRREMADRTAKVAESIEYL